MNEATLEKVTEEISPVLLNQRFGKIFRPSKLRFVIDFRLAGGMYLFISTESISPRIYLVKRNLRELEKSTLNPNAFVVILTKYLSNAFLREISKDDGERILRFKFETRNDLEGIKFYTFVVQLTGRSANLFLLNDRDFIIDSLRENEGDGQTVATRYAAPPSAENRNTDDAKIFPQGDFATLSAALDAHYQAVEYEKLFAERVKSAETKIKQEIAKRERLKKKLQADLENHGDAEKWKRLGDLLLANLSNAARVENTVLVTDYFQDDAPTVEIEADENLSLTEVAEKFFKRYTKARNARKELGARLETIEAELVELNLQKDKLKDAAIAGNEEFLPAADDEKRNRGEKTKPKKEDFFKGARRYKSSDGWEILVGKASKDNDFLTFKIAKSLDFWLHAADYGGSHVVVKNPDRTGEMPAKTLFEAAELAAWFSQAKAQPKVAVNYTQKKFVNKPKGAAAGLVSLSAFKTILVEPKESLERV